jgi:mRNA interferase RelE/StbE|tara:strand:+ start:273 stop:530 length:258 start_codon:yes stop_codon:yes gene_type:complete
VYQVSWDEGALDDLRAIDKTMAKKIIHKVENYLTKSPIELGKTLSAEYKGLYRYRYGDYRIVYQLIEKEFTIIVVKVGHRSSVYT